MKGIDLAIRATAAAAAQLAAGTGTYFHVPVLVLRASLHQADNLRTHLKATGTAGRGRDEP